jgi:hypothetical protein
MTFTNAQKSNDVVPFISIHEATFLKRSFVYREDFSRWLAPLDVESLTKTLRWKLPSSVLTSYQQEKELLRSVIWELFFHLSYDSFHQARLDLIDAGVRSLGAEADDFIREDLATLPTYDDILSSVGFRNETEVLNLDTINR